MKKRYTLFLQGILFLLLCSTKTLALNVLVTQSPGGVFTMPARWQSVLTGMGHTVNIQPISVLDNNSFFATTNVLIVSDGTAAYTTTQVNTIRAFLQSGKSVYLQSEYLSTYDGNEAFATIVAALGSSFTWGATQSDDQNPTVHGTFAVTNNAVPSLPYFWYGCTGTPGSNIFPFIKSTPGSIPLGWCFCPANASYGKLITTSDQDWIQNSATYPIATDLMENIFTHLITPGLCGPSTPPTAVYSSSTNVSCNGGSNGSATIAAYGSAQPLTYSWAPSGGTGLTASGLTAGIYTCTVTDANGATDTVMVTITQPPVLSSTGTDQDVSCAGSCGGKATVTVSGGTPPYTYSWSPSGGTGATANNLCVNNYTVNYTDSKGCPGSRTFNITQVAPTTATTSKTDVSCNGGNDGTAKVTASGGVPPYTYSWAPSGGTADSASGLTAGTYTCTITDASGCQTPKTITINEPAGATISTSHTNVSCAGGNNGSATVTVTGGSATYAWTPGGATTASITNLVADTYTCVVTVAGACAPQTKQIIITQPDSLKAMVTGANLVGCPGGNNGSITLSVTGGTPPYTYLWSPTGGTAATATGLPAGTYSCLITDSNNCSITKPGGVISQPSFTAHPHDTAVCAGTNASFSMAITGSGNTYQWQVNTGSGFTNVTNTVPYSGATTNTLLITGATAAMNGYQYRCLAGSTCTSPTDTALLSVNVPIIPSATGVNPTGCTTNDGTITLGGMAPNTSYLTGFTHNGTPVPATAITSNAGGSIVINGLGAGNYTNIFATLNGCASHYSGSVALSNPALPVVNAATLITVCAGDTVFLTASSATGGVAYSWNGPGGYTSSAQNPVITATTPAMSGNYIVTASLLGCVSQPDTTAVTINARPAAPIVAPVAYCQNAPSTALSATGSNLLWYTAPGGGTGSSTAPIPSTAAVGTNTWYVSQTNLSGCEGPRAAITVTVNPNPVIALGPVAHPTTCTGNQGRIVITGLTASASYTLNYTKGGSPVASSTFTATAAGTDTITGLTAGTYTAITVTNTNSCVSNVLGPVTLNDPAPPATPAPTVNGPICATQTLNLGTAAVSGATYAWTGPNSFTSTSQNPSITNATTAATGTYSVTVTVANCTSQPGTVNATVKPKPDAPAAGSNSPVCAGSPLNLTASAVASATYAWTGPSSYSNSTQNPTIASPATSAAGTYSVTATVNGCTSNAGTVSVTVYALPAAPGVSNISYCQYEPSVALTATGTSLKWYTGPSGGTGNVSAPVPATGTAGTFTWYVSQTNSNNCEGPRAALTVTIKPKPAPPVPLAPAAYSLCQYSISPLSATGTNLLWYTAPAGGTGTSTYTAPTGTPGTYTMYVSQTVNGCESDRATISYIVKPKPAPPVVNSPKVMCQFDPQVPLTASGQNLLWYPAASGGGGTSVAPIPSTGFEDTMTYFVSQTVDGCESDRSLLEVHVHYKPNALILASRPWVCSGDTLSFMYFGNARPDANYSWKNPIPQSAYVSGGGQGPWIVQFDEPGTQTVSLTVDNHGCLSPVATQTIEVRPLPEISIVANKEKACLGDVITVALNASTPGVSGFNWDFSGAQQVFGSSPGGPYGLRWNTPGTYVVSATGVARGCRSKPADDTITVHPLPQASITLVSKTDICSGDSVQLRALVTNDSLYYHWSPAVYFSDTSGTDVWANPDFTGFIHLQVSDTNGCRAADSVLISAKPCCEVYFPNAFSPNNDGRNDVFRIISQGHHSMSSLRVVNRWGQVVYETADARRGWDGTFGGKPQDMGVYYYHIRYKCSDGKDYEQKGEVTLIR